MDSRARREGEAGWTLIELLVVMVISLVIGAAALMAIRSGQESSTKTAARQEAVQEAQTALARLAGETRQAVAARLWSADFLDLKTRVRPGGGSSELHRIQYDCRDLSACVRKDCGAVAQNGTLASLGQSCSGTTTDVVRGLDAIAFGAEREGAAVAIPAETTYGSVTFDFVSVGMRIRLDDPEAGRTSVEDLDPVEIQGGVKLENVFAP